MSDTSTSGTDQSDAGVLPGWLETAFFLLLIGWFGYLIVEALGWRANLESTGFPFAGTVAGVALAVGYLLMRRLELADLPLVVSDESEGFAELTPDSEGPVRPVEERRTTALSMVMWVTALPLLIFVFGFTWSFPVFIFAFLYYFKRDLTRAVLVSVVLSATIYVLFRMVLRVRWYGGLIGDIFSVTF